MRSPKKSNSDKGFFDEIMKQSISSPVDDIVYRQKFITKITQYQQLFFQLLLRNNIKINELESKSITELEELLYKIKEIVQNRNMLSNVKNATQLFPSVIEHVAKTYTPLKLDGYARALNANEDYEMMVNEILLEYDIIDNLKINPMNRLAYTLFTTGVLVHKANTIKEEQIKNTYREKPINENLKAKYSDL